MVDIRGKLPRNPNGGPNQRRALSRVSLMGWHWDGGASIPEDYDPLSYYIGEARFHISKNWNGPGEPPAYGDGLMYTAKLARSGILYWTRDFEDVLWAAMGANPIGIWVCVDASYGSPLTVEQKAAMPLVEQWAFAELGRKVPVTGHGLLTSYGNSTDCPGPEIRAYLQNTGRGMTR